MEHMLCKELKKCLITLNLDTFYLILNIFQYTQLALFNLLFDNQVIHCLCILVLSCTLSYFHKNVSEEMYYRAQKI